MYMQQRLLLTLVFDPSFDVIDAFGQLLGSDFYLEHEDLLAAFLNCLHHRFFSLDLWNAGDLVTEDVPRTSNEIEGFSSLLNAVHPSI